MADLTDTTHDTTSRMEIDAVLNVEEHVKTEIDYQEQRRGMILTSSSVPAPEYLKFKLGNI